MNYVIEHCAEATTIYSREGVRLIAQFQSENPGANEHTLPIIASTEWFLNSHGRWSQSSIRVFALSLAQELEGLLEYDTFDPDSPEGQLLHRLKKDRPASSKKVAKTSKEKQVAHQKKVAAKQKKATTKKRKKRRKSLPMMELRELRKYFSSRPDEFAKWIAGYILIASRLGWRPGEIINLERDGNIVRAAAQKHSSNRGLAATCEVDISAYFEKARLMKNASIASEIDRWIADAQKWLTYYGDRKRLLAAINGRLATASKFCKIARVCTYTFRHFAISCMKASQFSCAEIAVIINHASDRTAGEHYGKRQHGVKRPKKMLRFDKSRLPLVRNQTRAFNRPSVLEKKSTEEMPARRTEEVVVTEVEAVSLFSF